MCWPDENLIQDIKEHGTRLGWSDTVVETAIHLLDKLDGKESVIGDTTVVDGISIETHTLGCRREAGTSEDEIWDEHWAIHDEYTDSENTVVLGDPSDGIFISFTGQPIPALNF